MALRSKIAVTVKTRGAFRALQRAEVAVARAAGNSVESLTEAGMRYAKSVAPFYTGRTASMIRKRISRDRNGKKGTIIAPNSTKSDGHDRGYTFNLVDYMHQRKNFKHFHKDRPDFMNVTRTWLNRQKGRIARNTFTRINLR